MTDNLPEEATRQACAQIIDEVRKLATASLGSNFWELHPHHIMITAISEPGKDMEVVLQPKHALDVLLKNGRSAFAKTFAYTRGTDTPADILATLREQLDQMDAVLLYTQVHAFLLKSGILGADALLAELREDYKQFDRQKVFPAKLPDGSPNPARTNYVLAVIRRFMASADAGCPKCQCKAAWQAHDGGWSCRSCRISWYMLPRTNGWRIPAA